MSDREVLALVRQLLAEGLEKKQKDGAGVVRWLSQEIGDLRATMRAAVTVIDQAEAEK
ncbi:hypothetical protein [Streptomyces sp. SAS_275]|uniref:hypothetical protein n=1 Tax=Streptomyces sp. SAS_275 TaxID=3412746 RepID=UPI00403C70D2